MKEKSFNSGAVVTKEQLKPAGNLSEEELRKYRKEGKVESL